jgi:hypothetical protein
MARERALKVVERHQKNLKGRITESADHVDEVANLATKVLKGNPTYEEIAGDLLSLGINCYDSAVKWLGLPFKGE